MFFFAAEWGLRAAGDGVNLPRVDIWGKKKQICTKPSDPSRLRPKAPAAVLRGNPKKIKIKPKGHDVAKPTQGRTPKNAPFPAQKCFFFSIIPISRYFGVGSAGDSPGMPQIHHPRNGDGMGLGKHRIRVFISSPFKDAPWKHHFWGKKEQKKPSWMCRNEPEKATGLTERRRQNNPQITPK